jgi:Fe-Mn family superoxide dismutase
MLNYTRREILQTGLAGAAALALAPLGALAQGPKGYTLPKLPYDTDALEPYIDTLTMQIHHGKHHLAYITAANNILKGHPVLHALPPNELLANIDRVPETIRQGVINAVGGHSNHSIFWEIMGPKAGGSPRGALAKDIAHHFGSFDKLKKQLSEAGATQFGSGWAWLVVNKKGELEVVKRANQDSPIMAGLKPVLGVDVWEHAYYLKYQNLRAKYIEAWWNVVNWTAVSERVAHAKKG